VPSWTLNFTQPQSRHFVLDVTCDMRCLGFWVFEACGLVKDTEQFETHVPSTYEIWFL